MTQFIITAPSGKKYKVNGPEGSTKEDALRKVQEQLGAVPARQLAQPPPVAAPPPQVGVGEDMAKSFGAGVGKGVTGLVGLPRDIADLTQSGVEWGANKLGFDGANAGKMFSRFNPTSYLPGSADIQSEAEKTTGKFYEPKTTAGEWAGMAGEFAPSAVAGPGGLLRKTAMTLIPATTTFAADKLTGGNPYAKVGAGLLGGGVASMGGGRRAVNQLTRKTLDSAPSHAETSTMVDNAYDAIKAKDIQVKPREFKTMTNGLSVALEGMDANVAPHAHALKKSLDNVLEPLKVGPPTHVDTYGNIVHNPPVPDTRTVSLNKIENVRKNAAAAARDWKLSETERAAAGKIVSAIEKHYETVPGLKDEFASARELARREILSRQLGKMENKSEWYTSGDESGLRNQVGSFGKREGHNLTDAEKAAYKKIQRREGVNNSLTNMGGRLGHIAMSAAGISLGGVPGWLAAEGLHFGARKLSEAKTFKAVRDARKTVLLGKERQETLLGKVKDIKRDAKAKSTTRNLLNSESSAQQGKPLPAIKLSNGSTYWNPTRQEYQRYLETGSPF